MGPCSQRGENKYLKEFIIPTVFHFSPSCTLQHAVSPQVPIKLDDTKASAENVMNESSLETWRLQDVGQSGSSDRTSGSYAQDSIDTSPTSYAGNSWNASILQS